MPHRYSFSYKPVFFWAVLALLPSCPITAGNAARAGSAEPADTLMVRFLRERGVRFTDDNAMTLLTSGQAKFDDLFRAVAQARRSIHLEYFNFRNDSISGLLFRLLEQKAAEGVEVRALFDSFGNASNNQPLRRRHLDALRQQGVEIREFRPMRFPWTDYVVWRDHRKIAVIDGQVAYTGGMNVADYYITGTPAVGDWHDMHCRIEGSAVNTLQSIFLRAWNKTAGQNVSGAQYYYESRPVFQGLKPDTTATRGSKLIGIINREPHRTPAIIRDFYTHALDVAQDSVQLISPYFTLNGRLKRAFRRAVKRGVRVDILLSTRGDVPLTPDCGFYNAHKLMKHGCHIWLYPNGFHHTKIIMVDGRFCTVGSANLDARSLYFDREENAVVIDRHTTAELQRVFRSQQQESWELTEDKWKQWRTPWQRFRGWVGHLLAPIL